MIFLWNAGEEKGLWGSQYFNEYPSIDITKVVADLNIDMIGRTKGPATRELDAAPQQVLPEPMPSVTEHTTRAFDPVYNKRDNSPSSN